MFRALRDYFAGDHERDTVSPTKGLYLNSPENDRLLAAALQHGVYAFALWDRDLNLIAANRRYPDLHKIPEEMLHEGINALEIMSSLKARGLLSGNTDPEKLARYIARELASAGQLVTHVSFTDGTVLEISAERMTDGNFVTFLRDASHQHMKERKWDKRETRADAYTAAISTFNALNPADDGLRPALDEVTRTIATLLDVDRCVIWTLNPSGETAQARSCFMKDTGHTLLPDITMDKAEIYASVLRASEIMAIPDLEKHIVSAEYNGDAPDAVKARAKLDATIRLFGQPVGSLSCLDQTRPRYWKPEDKLFVMAAAARIGACLEAEAGNHATDEAVSRVS